MPVSVNAVLRESLAETGHTHHLLQSQISSGTKHLVLKTIEYEEYPENFLAQNDALKAKYILLSSSSSSSDKNSATGNGPSGLVKKTLASPASHQNGVNGSDASSSAPQNGTGTATTPKKEPNKNELPQPKRTLFPREKVQIGWKGGDRKWAIGAGFVNVGNTCYLNSTLQALLHVPAMANWLASDTEHRERCCSEFNDMCIICAVAKTLHSSQASSGAVKPWLVYSRLKQICKHLVAGRQEDAHEFLRYLIEAMEKAFLNRFGKAQLAALDQYSKETTPLNQILGGYLRSSVRCLSCNHISITFQHFEDLLLDIRKANTVDEALQGYFSREKLEDMGYNCEGCKKKVTATKQFSLERPPVVLCLQLKRFSMQGTKLNKQVSIKPQLDLTPFVRKPNGNSNGHSLTYRLVSMVTHLGSSQHCGHYTAIGLTDSGTYYQFDDSSVHPISLQNVLQTNAYIIFYELENAGLHRQMLLSNRVAANATNGNHALPATITTTTAKTNAAANGTNGVSHSKSFIGPVLPPNHPTVNRTNGDTTTTTNGKTTTLTNGHSGGNTAKLNQNKTQESPTTTTTAAGPTLFRKYPSAELLFKSPTKATNGHGNGRLSPSPSTSSAAAGNQQQISPKSLVPYNSNLSSDEDSDADEKEANGEKPRKTNGSNGGPYVNSPSGPWKVCNADSENKSPPKATHNQQQQHQNGSAKVLNELLKQDHNAYGGVSVNTWSGQKSSLDKDTSAEKLLKRQAERKADDEEMDRGHVKKVKLNHHQKVGRDNPGYNAFQELQNKQQQQQQQQQGNGGGFQRQWVNNGTMYKSKHHHHHGNHRPNNNGHHHHHHRPNGNSQRPSQFRKRPRHWQNQNRNHNRGGFKGHFGNGGRKQNGGGGGGGFRNN